MLRKSLRLFTVSEMEYAALELGLGEKVANPVSNVDNSLGELLVPHLSRQLELASHETRAVLMSRISNFEEVEGGFLHELSAHYYFANLDVNGANADCGNGYGHLYGVYAEQCGFQNDLLELKLGSRVTCVEMSDTLGSPVVVHWDSWSEGAGVALNTQSSWAYCVTVCFIRVLSRHD